MNASSFKALFLFLLIVYNIKVMPNDDNLPNDNIDVLDYKIKIDLREAFNNQCSNFTGNVVITCKIDTLQLDKIILDAIGLTFIDIKVNDIKTNYVPSDKYISIMLDKSYFYGDTVKLEINYNHIHSAPSDTGFYFFKTSVYNSEEVAYTASWPCNTRYWLPCKDWPSDKATEEVSIIVPKGITAVSNGRLVNKLDSLNSTTFIWRESHPMATYVISISASKFTVSKRKIEIDTANSDSLELNYYALKDDSINAILGLNNIPKILSFYSERFCYYPFDLLSIVIMPRFIFAGMSNQSLIQLLGIDPKDSSESRDLRLLPHELAHQWFGSYVNATKWELWMTEGMADYASLLYKDFVVGKNYYLNEVRERGTSHLKYDSLNTISDYYKLPVVLEMLRTIMGDSSYWKAMKTYLNKYAYSNASTEDFISAFNEVSRNNYDWFFNEWFLGAGHPIYNVDWSSEEVNDTTYLVAVNIIQSQTLQSVFIMPVDITIKTIQMDTTFRITNDKRNQSFEFLVSSRPNDIIFDKDTLILIKEIKYNTADVTIYNNDFIFSLAQNYPNPFNPTTKIGFRISKFGFVSLKIFDILGKEVVTLLNEERKPGTYNIQFLLNNYQLPSGIYFYQLQSAEGVITKKMLLLK